MSRVSDIQNTTNKYDKKKHLKTYSTSKSLSLYIQKFVETMSSSSLVPSRPTKTRKEPIPWRTIPSRDRTSAEQKQKECNRRQWSQEEVKLVG